MVAMAKLSVHLTMEELRVLLSLAENQLFRVKYIDPKMPGYKEQPDHLRAAQSAVQILQDAFKAGNGLKPIPAASVSRRRTATNGA